MPKYRLLYHPLVLSRDIPRLDSSVRKRLRTAIEGKLTEHPEAFAKPLSNTTQRLWSLRAGDWRVIFALRNDEVWIERIGNRRDVYTGSGYPEPPGEYSVFEPGSSNP